VLWFLQPELPKVKIALPGRSHERLTGHYLLSGLSLLPGSGATVITQFELGAIVPLFSVTEVPPLTAVSEAEAPHPVRVGLTGLARKTLPGRVSINETWVRLLPASLFLIVIES
jgi:hypothetical protein